MLERREEMLQGEGAFLKLRAERKFLAKKCAVEKETKSSKAKRFGKR